jgi:hypothetical protein
MLHSVRHAKNVSSPHLDNMSRITEPDFRCVPPVILLTSESGVCGRLPAQCIFEVSKDSQDVKLGHTDTKWMRCNQASTTAGRLARDNGRGDEGRKRRISLAADAAVEGKTNLETPRGAG